MQGFFNYVRVCCCYARVLLFCKGVLVVFCFPGGKQSTKRWTPAQILRAPEEAAQLAVTLLLALTNGQIVPHLASSFCFIRHQYMLSYCKIR